MVGVAVEVPSTRSNMFRRAGRPPIKGVAILMPCFRFAERNEAHKLLAALARKDESILSVDSSILVVVRKGHETSHRHSGTTKTNGGSSGHYYCHFHFGASPIDGAAAARTDFITNFLN